MQDRFKFRIFDKEQKKIVTTSRHFNFGIVNGTVVLLESYPTVAGFYNKRLVKEYDDVILMQCTGLKDKNGKLIYEGDIVNYDSRDLFPHTTIKTGKITQYHYSWVLSYYDKNCVNAKTQKPALQNMWLGCDDFIGSRIEVVGNIYENPELLEDK